MNARFAACLLGVAWAAAAPAAENWLANDYWADGRAEFLIYEGTQVRYGQPHPAEVTHIFVREDLTPDTFVKADDWRRPGTYPVIKLNQVLHIQTGLYVYQQMHSAFWRLENAECVKWSLTSNDSCGNTFKIGLRSGAVWNVRYETYWEGMDRGEERLTPPADAWFYDELPLRVRSLDFTAATGSRKVPIAPTVIGSKKDSLGFVVATVSHRRSDDGIVVEVAHARGTDVFQLADRFPYLIREWKAWDGSLLKLKHALKVKYWELNQPGARERALADPANRLGSVR